MPALKLPAPTPIERPAVAQTPRFSEADATRLGLVTMRQLADHYGSSVDNVRFFLRRDGAPQVVGETEKPNKTRREKLVVLRQFEAFVEAQGGTFGSRRRSRPPRRVGTSTPGAGRAYRWRDPARGYGS